MSMLELGAAADLGPELKARKPTTLALAALEANPEVRKRTEEIIVRIIFVT